MLDHVADLGQHQSRFAHKALIVAFSKIGGQGVVDLVLVFLNRGIELFQLLHAEFDGNRCAASVKGPLLFQQTLYFLIRHFVFLQSAI